MYINIYFYVIKFISYRIVKTKQNIALLKTTKRKIFIKNKYHPTEKGEGESKDSRRITMSVTAAISPYESTWGRRRGCLGFLV
jgi:hypothetical protein